MNTQQELLIGIILLLYLTTSFITRNERFQASVSKIISNKVNVDSFQAKTRVPIKRTA